MSGDNSTSRVLNQDEIDSLLGFREAADGPRERSGIEAIIDSGMVSYERLPMLEVVFDRLVRMMSTRSEERRVGKECVSTCRSRWSPYHKKKKNKSNSLHNK